MPTLPEMMTAIGIVEPGGPEVLVQETRPLPTPRDGEILIQTAFAGVNRPDILQRTGAYPPPPGTSDLPGLEVAGRVVATGSNVELHGIGDLVCALCPGGGYAEFVAVPASHALPLPKGFDLKKSAALPETYFTVWTNLFQRGGLKSGETVLIHGGSSGIGTTVIQLANAFGAMVITTAGTAEKCQACRDLGAAHAINYREQDFVSEVREITDGQGANVILDMVGGDYIERNFRAASLDGRILQIAFLGGRKATVDFTKLMVKRLTHTGSTLRPQSIEAKAKIACELKENVWPLLEQGIVGPVIDATFALEDADDAHRHMEAGQHIGKIMLKVESFE